MAVWKFIAVFYW